MINYFILTAICASFLITLFAIPSWIKRAKRANLVGRNVHNVKDSYIAESGGVTIIAGFALGVMIYIAVNTFIFKRTDNLIEIFALLSCVFLISFVAFTDDMLGWKIGLGKRTRLVLLAFASVPLVVINAGDGVVGIPFNGFVDLGILYPLLLIPIGIVGATATFNFLAGFNGQEAGLGVILLTAMGGVAYFTGSPWLAVIALCMVASLLAFLLFNFYPAKILGGDSLTYAVGSLVAILAILGNFEKIAVFFFIPYCIETVLKLRGGLKKQSFGLPQEDGSLDLRYDKFYSLNHFAIAFLKKINVKSTEKRVVYCIWAFQAVIILIGLVIFRGGIFV